MTQWNPGPLVQTKTILKILYDTLQWIFETDVRWVLDSTVKLGNKELFGHPKIVPQCQKFLIANIELKYYIRYT